MTPEPDHPECDRKDEKFLAFCGISSRAAAGFVFLIGFLNLLGWFFSRSFLLWISPNGVAMPAGAAFACVLSGTSLWLWQKESEVRFAGMIADLCALLVALSGILAMTGYLAGWYPGVDRLFPWKASGARMFFSPRMGPNAALIFTLLGGSMLPARRRIGSLTVSGMAVAAGFVGILGLMGYAYEAESLTHIGPYKHIAFQTTLAGVVLATGILFGMKDLGLTGYLSLDGAGSVMARNLLPALVLVPVLFGLLKHSGGQLGLFRPGIGVALMVVFSMFTLAAVVWRNAVMLNRSDRERKRADRLREGQKKELAWTAELLEKIFSNIHLKVAYMDPRFNILRVNQAYADAGGHSPGFYVGRNHFDLYPHEENEAIFRRVVETGEPFAVFSKPFEYPDHPGRGTTYWDWSLQPVRETGGTVVGVVLSLVDVTERVRAESLLREKEEEELRQEKMALLGVMAAGIAHEVRNPLSGLNFSLSAAETACRGAEEMDPETREMMGRAIASSQRASAKIGEVIRRVMDFARPGKIAMEKINVNDAVREAMNLYSPTLRKTGIRVDTALSEDLPSCNADLRLIEQLFLNLINNAAQAVETRDGERRIEISSRTEGNRILLTVADSGPGVSEPLREKIFDPFFTTRPVGTGLGLSISRRIVAEHGGSIEVGTSRFGGAEFRVSLPAAADGGLVVSR